MPDTMTQRERFHNLMEYKPVDRLPNYEVGVWGQTIDTWKKDGLDINRVHWDWFIGESTFGMDPREYIPINSFMVPHFEVQVLERTDRYEIVRQADGVVTKALIEGTSNGSRMCMDQYIRFPVETPADFIELKKRYDASNPVRMQPFWREFRVEGWKNRQHPLVLGRNTDTLGFYWMLRQWMGTENASYALYDQPELVHDIMQFHEDFLIKMLGPVLDTGIAPEYMFMNEDMAMKNGPLIGPKQYKEFIFPHMKRVVDFVKGKGVSYVIVDSDGNTEPLLPMLMEAGVDGIWPMERASQDQDPMLLRRKYGKQLRLWGGVDKRELSKGKKAIQEHLRSLIPIVEDGGFIPTVDHLVQPDVSLDNFKFYMEKKMHLLRYEFEKI